MPKKKQLPDFSIDISIDEYNISPKKKRFFAIPSVIFYNNTDDLISSMIKQWGWHFQ